MALTIVSAIDECCPTLTTINVFLKNLDESCFTNSSFATFCLDLGISPSRSI